MNDKTKTLGSIVAEIAFGNRPALDANLIGLSGHSAIVHKDDEEGGCLIDAFSGQVLLNQPDRPAWSNGMACAIFGERHKFYTDRLGEKLYDEYHRTPEAYNALDLSWVGIDEEGREVEIEADHEYRLQVVQEVLAKAGIAHYSEEADAFVAGPDARNTYEVEVSLDRERTPEELSALEETQRSFFMPITAADQKTGTNG